MKLVLLLLFIPTSAFCALDIKGLHYLPEQGDSNISLEYSSRSIENEFYVSQILTYKDEVKSSSLIAEYSYGVFDDLTFILTAESVSSELKRVFPILANTEISGERKGLDNPKISINIRALNDVKRDLYVDIVIGHKPNLKDAKTTQMSNDPDLRKDGTTALGRSETSARMYIGKIFANTELRAGIGYVLFGDSESTDEGDNTKDRIEGHKQADLYVAAQFFFDDGKLSLGANYTHSSLDERNHNLGDGALVYTYPSFNFSIARVEIKSTHVSNDVGVSVFYEYGSAEEHFATIGGTILQMKNYEGSGFGGKVLFKF